MIKAIDLRIGNWVEFAYYVYCQITNGTIIDHFTANDANPIPLTAELLLALGFVQREGTELYEFNGSNFAYHIAARRVLIWHPGNGFCHWLGSYIDHVHQIQNLYYCLIGKDLVLKLD